MGSRMSSGPGVKMKEKRQFS